MCCSYTVLITYMCYTHTNTPTPTTIHPIKKLSGVAIVPNDNLQDLHLYFLVPFKVHLISKSVYSNRTTSVILAFYFMCGFS